MDHFVNPKNKIQNLKIQKNEKINVNKYGWLFDVTWMSIWDESTGRGLGFKPRSLNFAPFTIVRQFTMAILEAAPGG